MKNNLKGDCVKDFNYKLSDGGQSIHISDNDENDGTVCMLFTATLGGKEYKSEDPQVENKKEL